MHTGVLSHFYHIYISKKINSGKPEKVSGEGDLVIVFTLLSLVNKYTYIHTSC